MLFSGFISSVSKPFLLKSNQNIQGCFFTLMVNSGEKSAKYIKCLTYSKSLISVLENGNKYTVISVLKGYPDTSFNKDYLNTKTHQEGVYLQHFVVTAGDSAFLPNENILPTPQLIEYDPTKITTKEEEETITEEESEEVKEEKIKEVINQTTTESFDYGSIFKGYQNNNNDKNESNEAFDGDGDLDEDTKENNENRQS